MSCRRTLQSDSPKPETRNWLDLPREVTSTIFQKLGAVETLTSVQLVCTQWWSISKEPLMWRTIDLRLFERYNRLNFDMQRLCRHAIDRSCGQLVDITLDHFGTDSLLLYMAESACHLRRLRLVCCFAISDNVLRHAAKRLPWLEELDISIGKMNQTKRKVREITKDGLQAIGQCCPLLKSLKFNRQAYSHTFIKCDDDAFAIAKTMPKLLHLQLFGNALTDVGLLAILDGCPQLESLDLRQCYNVTLEGGLGRRCSEQVKNLRYPLESTHDDRFDMQVISVEDLSATADID